MTYFTTPDHMHLTGIKCFKSIRNGEHHFRPDMTDQVLNTQDMKLVGRFCGEKVFEIAKPSDDPKYPFSDLDEKAFDWSRESKENRYNWKDVYGFAIAQVEWN